MIVYTKESGTYEMKKVVRLGKSEGTSMDFNLQLGYDVILEFSSS